MSGDTADPAEKRSTSPAPSADADTVNTRHMKRNREAAMGPATPRTEDDAKALGATTPLAKKGRVQGDNRPLGATGDDDGSDGDSQIAEDDEGTAGGASVADVSAQRKTPPASAAPGLDQTSAPPTPLQAGKEGKETRSIRRRVEALEWEDGHAPTDEDAQIADVAADVAESAEIVADKDEALAREDVEIASVAGEVSKSAAQLADKQEEKQEQSEAIAEVAAEVAMSAQAVDSAAEVKEAGEAKAEPSEVAQASPPAKSAAPTPTANRTSFSAFTSASSPFSSVAAAASPLAAVSSKSASSSPERAPQPASTADLPSKAKPVEAAPSTPAPASRVSTATLTNASAPPETPAAVSSLPAWAKSSAAPAPSTPLGKSPFSAFSGSSGFASASASKSGSGFGSYSAQTASPFASVASKNDRKDAAEDTGRKIGEVEEPDPSKKLYTEQEVVTGEEKDELLHSVRCKLFVMQAGSWVERGTGLLKLNATRDADKKGARLVMRADATHRLLLNAPLFSKFSIEVSQEKYVRFVIIENAEPISYMLRTSGPANAQSLVQAVQERLAIM